MGQYDALTAVCTLHIYHSQETPGGPRKRSRNNR